MVVNGISVGQIVQIQNGHLAGQLARVVAVGVTDSVPTREEVEKYHRDPLSVTLRPFGTLTHYVVPADLVHAL